MKKLACFFVILVFAGAAALAWFYMDLLGYAETPLEEGRPREIILVSPGQGLKQVAASFHEAGIIDDPLRFRLYARLKKYDRQIHAGEYEVSPAMSPDEILRKLIDGRVVLRKITIPEGYTLSMIARVMAESGLTDEKAFIRAAQNPEFIRQNGIEADSLEGYLFPDTYFFPGSVTPETILLTMIGQFNQTFTPEWKNRAEELGFSVHEVVTLASIVEKETGDPGEREIISSVFHNRLKRNMRLESDPTVIYGIPDFDGNLTRKHLKTMTPYNTYRISGLPLGPIAAPGKKALEAVLYPKETKYLYFVSRKDGTHQFSTNLADHNRAVGKYQLNR